MNVARVGMAAVGLIALCAGAVWMWSGRTGTHSPTSEAPESVSPSTAPSTTSSTANPVWIRISREKQEAAQLQIGQVQLQPLEITWDVPGYVGYDETRRVALSLPVPGVVTKVLVRVGDQVSSGKVLLIASSPEVAAARADVLLHREELKIAERAREYQLTIRRDVKQLLEAFSAGLQSDELRALSQKLRLGKFREELLSAYSALELAQRLVNNAETIRDSGAVPLRMLEERRSQLLSAEAVFQGRIEQSRFEIEQELARANAAANDARRRLKISEDHLQTLLGYRDSPDPMPGDESQLSRVEVRAPMDGTVQAVHTAVSQRVEPTKPLLDLADTRRMWVAADIRDREWQALQLQAGQDVEIECPAIPEHRFRGVVHFVGQEVDPQSRAVRLIVQVENIDGQFRPGQFVRVHIPSDSARQALVVPDSSVVGHEGREFVFRARSDEEFEPVQIGRGACFDGWTEITSGLQLGDRIVTQGAFICKSEWLLSLEVE